MMTFLGTVIVGFVVGLLARALKPGDDKLGWFMTTLLHDFDGEDTITRRFRRAQLDYLVSSRAASTSLAENYVGLPFEGRA